MVKHALDKGINFIDTAPNYEADYFRESVEGSLKRL